jgi:hypothetical protein
VSDRIRTEEQVADRAPQQIGDAATRQMMRAIVYQVAALAKAAQISRTIIAGIVIEVGRREHDAASPDACCFLNILPSCWLTPIAAPDVSPTSNPAIWQTTGRLSM